MRLVFSADFQSERSNLDLCHSAFEEMLLLAEKYRLKGVVILGDGKRAYNPLDGVVVNFWQDWIEKFRSEGLWFGFLLGNHDRYGQTDQGQNWLPILERAGAHVFAEPQVFGSQKVLGEGRLFALPFSTDISNQQDYLNVWAYQEKHTPQDILIFHQDVYQAKYNKLGVRSDAKLTVKDFHASKYLACIGGHIHLHQRLGENIWYTGSPFCTDWGEANQRKGYVVVRDEHISFVASTIPGWFDPTWPGFRPQSLLAGRGQGSRLRIHPVCPASGSYGKTIERARFAAENKYPGVRIFVVPEFEEGERNDVSGIRPEDPDAVKIKAYVNQSVGDDLKADAERISNYLVRKLEKAVGHSVRSTEGILITKAKAENFLSFKKVEFDFTQKGITVVQGVNEDWGGRSNGAGKTSLLQLLPVGLFGTTFKGQKYDRWSRRGVKDSSGVEVSYRDARRSRVKVFRSRRPTGLRLTVNNVDHTTGLRSDARDATQGLIENSCGFTWDTFANSVYIDQDVARRFIQGAKKDRSAVLAHYQNLERFEKALALVKKDTASCEDQTQDYLAQKETLESQISDAESHLDTLQEQVLEQDNQSKSRIAKARRYHKELSEKFDIASAKRSVIIKGLKHSISTWQDKLKPLAKASTDAERALTVSKGVLSEMEDIPEGTGHCPTCLQVLKTNYIQETLAKLRKRVVLDEKAAKLAFDKALVLSTMLDKESFRIDQLTEDDGTEAFEVKQAKAALDRTIREESMENAVIVSATNAVKAQKRKLKGFKQKLGSVKKAIVALKESADFYEFCKEAFSRDGIPRFLNERLVPVLNKSAEYYSELFTDKTIQVRFEVYDEEFNVQVINATGGEAAEDQSTGEQALVGLIVSFALRSVAPKCNVLVLDEPGAGLDRGNARQFAKGLVKLSKAGGSIIICSHNEAILAELSQERTITVRKRKGISKIIN